MIEITCPKCSNSFQHESPQTDIVVKCPYCGNEFDIYVTPPAADAGQSSANIKIARKVAQYEKLLNILWIVIGIYQIFIGLSFGYYLTAALGVYNVCMTINGFRSIKNIYAGNPNVVKWYEDKFIWIIIFAVINLIIGGVIGVFLSLFNLYIRDYVLKHKYVFEGEIEKTESAYPQHNKDLTAEEKEKVDEYVKFIKSQRQD